MNKHKRLLSAYVNGKCLECGKLLEWKTRYYYKGAECGSEEEMYAAYLTDFPESMCATSLEPTHMHKEVNLECKNGHILNIFDVDKAKYKLGYKDDLSVIYDFRL